METKNHSNIKWLQKAGLLFAGFLFVAVGVAQAAAAITASPPTSGVPPSDVICPTVADPVCGDDGKTYGNECAANGAGVKIKYWGECHPEDGGEPPIEAPSSDEICPTEYDPVCGDNGATYGNECEANNAKVGIKYWGECHPEDEGEPPQKENDLENARNHLDNSRRDLKNRMRELDQNFRQSKADLGPVQGALNQWEQVLNKMQGYIDQGNTQGFWDVQQDEEQDARWAGDDAFQKAYKENEKVEGERNTKEKRRFLKDKERAIKDATRQKLDVSALQAKYEEIVACIGRMEGYITQPDYDQQEFWDINRDCDDLDRDFWDANNAFQQVQQRKDIERQVIDKQKFMKDKERAMKEAARGGNDITELQNIFGQMQSFLEKLAAFTQTPDFDPQEFWDMDRDFNDLETDFWELHRTFFEKQDQENMMRNVKDKQRMVKDLERECSKNRCSETAKQLIPKLKDLLAQMEKAVLNTEDKQFYWDLNSDFDQRSQEAWESMREVTEKQDTGRWLKDVGREFKHLEQWIKDLQRSGEKDMAAKIIKTINLMKEHYSFAKAAYEAGDFQGTREHLEEMNDVRMDLEDLRRDFEERRGNDFDFKELGFILEEIRRAEEAVRKAMAIDAVSPEQADLCLGYFEEGRTTIEKMKALFESGNQEEAEALGSGMEGLGMRAERDCGQFLEDGPGAEYEAYNEVYVDEDFQDVSQEIFEKIKGDVANRVLDHIKNNSDIFNSILENVGNQFADQIAQALEASTFVPPEFQKELLSRKAALLQQVKEMEELTARLQELKKLAAAELQEIQTVRNVIANYNFTGNAGDEMEEALDEFELEIEDLPKEQIVRKIAELKKQAAEKIQENKEDKFSKGIIAFLDADDNEWWARYAAVAKEAGFIKGTGESGFTEMNPVANTNVAEACTMFGRIVGVDPNGKPSSKVGQRMPDWAKPNCAALERRGVDLDALFGNLRPDAPVTRAQVARLLQEVFNLPMPSSASLPFKDVGEATNEELKATKAVFDTGIMTGYTDGSNEFGFDDPLNRAALVKVITGAVEMQGGDVMR